MKREREREEENTNDLPYKVKDIWVFSVLLFFIIFLIFYKVCGFMLLIES